MTCTVCMYTVNTQGQSHSLLEERWQNIHEVHYHKLLSPCSTHRKSIPPIGVEGKTDFKMLSVFSRKRKQPKLSS